MLLVFIDIAVGAPYDGPLERGAVYIFYGSKKGIRSKASQIIHSEEVSQTAMYTFGFSVSGSGIDLDNNQYPDLVVGSYVSNSAFVFRFVNKFLILLQICLICLYVVDLDL